MPTPDKADLIEQMLSMERLRQSGAAEADVARLTAQLQEAQRDIAGLEERWETHDSAVCPEDVGCVEYIGILERRLSAAESQLTALRGALNGLRVVPIDGGQPIDPACWCGFNVGMGPHDAACLAAKAASASPLDPQELGK